MAKFEIGEIAIIWKPDNINHKKEVKIVGLNIKSLEGIMRDYAIEIPGNIHHITGYWCIGEKYLRKKQPPQELGSWESDVWKELGWNPTKEKDNERVY